MVPLLRRLTLGMLFAAAIVPALAARADDESAKDDDTRNTKPAGPLAPVHTDQTYTMNALLGFVNSQPQFVGDLLRPLDDDLRSLARQSRNITDFKRQARAAIEAEMRRHVSEVLIASAAKASLTDEDKQKLDIFMNKNRFELLSKYGGSQAMADQSLKTNGSSLEKEMNDRRRKLTVDLYLHKQLWPRIVVTREMVLDEYQKDLKKWTQEPEVELFTITIPISRWLREPGEDGRKGPVIKNPTPAQIKAAEASAMALAKDLSTQVRAGGDWARLAEDNSADSRAREHGGRWPKVHKGSLAREEVEKYAFSLPANTLGEPMLLEDKDDVLQSVVMLIKVGDKKDERVIPFAEAQDDIKDRLNRQQYAALTNEYMGKLYKDAAVEAVDKMIDVALDAAVSRYAMGTPEK